VCKYFTADDRAAFLTEKMILRHLHSAVRPNHVIRFYGADTMRISPPTHFIFLEWAPRGSLRDLISTPNST
jgi:serine/threonine protein kinase